MSNVVGPVCHIPPANTPADPTVKALPGLPGPAGADINSLQQTVNQLLNVIKAMLGQNGAQGPQRKPDPGGNPGDFTQKSIKTTKTKIYQNNDPSTGNFVEVQTITNMVFANKSGATWSYKAPPAQAGGE